MTAGSDNLNNNGTDAIVENIGICGCHAYSLLGAFELLYQNGDYTVLKPGDNKKNMKIERLVKLRNPWGKGEWKGKWSDESNLWTESLKSKFGFSN